MAHTFTEMLHHIIFSTKDREPIIDADLKTKLYPYMGGIIRELKGKALIVNGPADHVHMLVSLSPVHALSDVMRTLKSNSSGWIHDSFPKHRAFAWQVGYGAFSVSHSNIADVSKYIANQEEHHRKTTFKEEFVLFLQKHEMEYDEHYLWE